MPGCARILDLVISAHVPVPRPSAVSAQSRVTYVSAAGAQKLLRPTDLDESPEKCRFTTVWGQKRARTGERGELIPVSAQEGGRGVGYRCGRAHTLRLFFGRQNVK